MQIKVKTYVVEDLRVQMVYSHHLAAEMVVAVVEVEEVTKRNKKIIKIIYNN
jgi:hypothetical protein